MFRSTEAEGKRVPFNQGRLLFDQKGEKFLESYKLSVLIAPKLQPLL